MSGATSNTATQTWAAGNDYAVDSGADSDGPNDLGAGGASTTSTKATTLTH